VKVIAFTGGAYLDHDVSRVGDRGERRTNSVGVESSREPIELEASHGDFTGPEDPDGFGQQSVPGQFFDSGGSMFPAGSGVDDPQFSITRDASDDPGSRLVAARSRAVLGQFGNGQRSETVSGASSAIIRRVPSR
jgi:hypothetical protein